VGTLVVFSRFCPFWVVLRLRCVGAGVDVDVDVGGWCEVVAGHRPHSHWHWQSGHRVVQVGDSQAWLPLAPLHLRRPHLTLR